MTAFCYTVETGTTLKENNLEVKEEILNISARFIAGKAAYRFKNTEIGIMIETPASVLIADALAALVDFFSVGTNDLLQYTLAADRQNPHVEALCRSGHEPVLRLVASAADAIHKRGGWIGICGELAADLSLTQRFCDMRVDELSVSPPYLLELRERVLACQ